MLKCANYFRRIHKSVVFNCRVCKSFAVLYSTLYMVNKVNVIETLLKHTQNIKPTHESDFFDAYCAIKLFFALLL
jgi:hypothetical protein